MQAKKAGKRAIRLFPATSSAEKRRPAVTAMPDFSNENSEALLTGAAFVLNEGDDGAPVLGLAGARRRGNDDQVRDRYAGESQNHGNGTRALHAQLLVDRIRSSGWCVRGDGDQVSLDVLSLRRELLQLRPLRSRHIVLAISEVDRDRPYDDEVVVMILGGCWRRQRPRECRDEHRPENDPAP